MARLYHDAQGVPVAFRRTAEEEAAFPVAGAAGSVAFDEAANAVLAQQVADGPQAYRVVAGVLRRDGVAVAVAADTQRKQDYEALVSGAAQAVADNAAFLALASPGNAQVAAQVKALSRQSSQIIKRLLQLARGF